MFETVSGYNVKWMTPREEFESFRIATESKLRGLRCPTHRRPPDVRFAGSSLRDVTIRMSGCCSKLMDLANAAIAGQQIAAAEQVGVRHAAWPEEPAPATETRQRPGLRRI